MRSKHTTSFIAAFRGLAFLTFTLAATGYSAPINVLGTQFTTAVSMTSIFNGTNFSRTQTSTVPFSDSLYYFDGGTVANANAGLLGISAQTSAYPTIPDFIDYASAFTESALWFSPLTSQTTTINIQIEAGPHFPFTSGNVSLFNVTSSNEVWNYGWGSWSNIYGVPAGINNGTPVPWDDLLMDPRTATLMLVTTLNASDTYELIIRTGSQAATDSENESIQLSGLEPVPEPSTFVIIGLGSLALAIGSRRRSSSSVS
jgi:hypothetical protein